MDTKLIIPLALVGIILFLYSRKQSTSIDLPENPYLVDVRTTQEFKGGSVEGAVNIPLSQVADRLAEFKEKENLVLFCRSGQRSGKAISILEKNGFTNIINGGGWKSLKNQLEK